MQEPDFSSRKPRFDPTVNLGHILTAIMMAGGFVGMWASMKVSQSEHNSRISVMEAAQAEMKSNIAKLAENANITARAQDRMSMTLEYLAKQAPAK